MFISKNYTSFILLLLLLIVPSIIKAETIDYPYVGNTNAPNTKIEKIERLENSTVVTVFYQKTLADPQQTWVSISSKTFIRWGNTNYKILGLGNNEKLNQKYDTTGSVGDTYRIVMVFPPIPLVAKNIDIIENVTDGFRWENINLNKSNNVIVPVPQNQPNALETSYNSVERVGVTQTKFITIFKYVKSKYDFLQIDVRASYVFGGEARDVPVGNMIMFDLFIIAPINNRYGLEPPTLQFIADGVYYDLGKLSYTKQQTDNREGIVLGRTFGGLLDLKKFRAIANAKSITPIISNKELALTNIPEMLSAFRQLSETISQNNESQLNIESSDTTSNSTVNTSVKETSNKTTQEEIDYTKISPKKISSILEVTSDMPSFVGVPVKVNAGIKISTYYNYKYREAQETHLAFEIRDETGSAHLYMLRGENAEQLRSQLIKAGANKWLGGTFTFVIKKDRFDKTGGLLAEFIDWSPLEK